MKEKIIGLLQAALKDLGEELGLAGLADASPSTCLFGRDSILDSMALVSLVADLEGRLAAEFGRNLVLAGERAMSQLRSPFRTVDSLAEHIERLLQEEMPA